MTKLFCTLACVFTILWSSTYLFPVIFTLIGINISVSFISVCVRLAYLQRMIMVYSSWKSLFCSADQFQFSSYLEFHFYTSIFWYIVYRISQLLVMVLSPFLPSTDAQFTKTLSLRLLLMNISIILLSVHDFQLTYQLFQQLLYWCSLKH